MTSALLTSLLLCGFGGLLYLLCLGYDPKKPHARWLRHGVVGLVMLMVWNALPLPHLGVNPVSVLTAGALGLPGVGLVAVMNWLR